jgi:large subunit ribosomal protein L22
MAFKATHRFARIAPRKARLVMDLIRGRDVDDALAMLQFSKKRAAVLIDKVVRSAVANASEQEADTNALFVRECWVDPGPIIKRFQPKDRGKAYAIQKKTSHLVVALDERA